MKFLRHITVCMIFFSTTLIHTMEPHCCGFCIIRPIIYPATTVLIAEGISLIRNNTQTINPNTSAESYQMTNILKGVAGYALAGFGLGVSAVTYLYCLNAK